MRNIKLINRIMETIPVEWRYNWCEAEGGCCCMGCVNVGARETQLKICSNPLTKEEWELWVKQNELIEIDGEIYTKLELRRIIREYRSLKDQFDFSS